MKDTASQSSNSGRRPLAPRAEVFGARDQTAPEEMQPNMVHGDASRQRILRRDDPTARSSRSALPQRGLKGFKTAGVAAQTSSPNRRKSPRT
jgi:hypothetical protein